MKGDDDIDMRQADGVPATDDQATQARRAFLKKAGAFAVYTPPVIMMLMHPSRTAVASGTKRNNGVRAHGPGHGQGPAYGLNGQNK